MQGSLTLHDIETIQISQPETVQKGTGEYTVQTTTLTDSQGGQFEIKCFMTQSFPDKEGEQDFISGLYKDIPGSGYTAPVRERAGLLREVSKSLIYADVPLEKRRKIIDELQSVFSVRLSEQGMEHFMGS